MALRKKFAQIAIKEEVTDGTFILASPAAGDLVPYVIPESIDVSPDIPNNERNDALGKLAKAPGVSGRRAGSISFDGYIVGGSVVAVAPANNGVWLITGHSEVVTPTTGPVTYTRSATDTTGYSIAALIDGIMYGLAGARATWNWTMTSGGLISYSCTVTGLWVPPTDVAIVTPAGPITLIPQKFMGATITLVGDTAAVLQEMTLDWQNEVTVREDASAADGTAGAALTDARMVGTANPEAVLIASEDRYQDWIDDTLATVTFSTGAGAGNVMTFTAPEARYTGISHGDRGNFLTQECEFEIVDSDVAAAEGLDFSVVFA